MVYLPYISLFFHGQNVGKYNGIPWKMDEHFFNDEKNMEVSASKRQKNTTSIRREKNKKNPSFLQVPKTDPWDNGILIYMNRRFLWLNYIVGKYTPGMKHHH